MVPTLIKACEQSRTEIKLNISVSEETLKVHVVVASAFLQPVEEVIKLPKKRTVTEHEFLARTVEVLGRRFEAFRRREDSGTYCNEVKSLEQELNGNGEQQITSIRLKKGKHLLTMSFFVRTIVSGDESFMYIYINNV